MVYSVWFLNPSLKCGRKRRKSSFGSLEGLCCSWDERKVCIAVGRLWLWIVVVVVIWRWQSSWFVFAFKIWADKMHWNVETDLNAKHGTCLDLLWTVSHVCIICASVPRSHLFCWMRVWVSGVVPLCSFMSQDGNSTIVRFHLEQLLIGCHFDETAFVFGSHRDSAFWWAGNVLRWRVFHWMQFQ